MKTNVIFCGIIAGILLYTVQVGAQEIVTAENYLARVAEKYGGIRDYEAKIGIKSGTSNMSGTLSYLSPTFLRIDFATPAEQVIVFNGETLTLYLPEYRAILNQEISGSRSQAASLATGPGLTMLRRSYTPSYVTGPTPEPLEAGSGEMVVKLSLARRSVSEGFRTIVLSIDPNTKLIRRVDARTSNNAQLIFDFTGIKANLGIPEQRFIYDSPASANMYNNFLFRDRD